MLASGSRIAVVAPGSVVDGERLEAGMAIARDWGFQLVEPPHLRARHRHTAGTPDERLADLTWALTAPDIDAVWFARGGYGAVHTLAGLPWDRLDDRPVIGYSDATALLVPLHARGRAGGIHGPVLEGLGRIDEPSRAALRALLTDDERSPLPGRSLGPAHPTVSGPVVGGNLTVLASLAGTPWALRGAGAIVVLEDVNERPYRLDRSLTQLLLGGAFAGARGVALGSFHQCEPDPPGDPLEELFLELLAALGIPVVAGLPVGHAAANQAWVYGAHGTLGADGITFAAPAPARR